MYGFDFLKHQCDNIGHLRKFVREHKNKQRNKAQKSEGKHSTPIHISVKPSREQLMAEVDMEDEYTPDRTEEQKFDEKASNDVEEHVDVRIELVH